jgi:hypothetical protein
MRAVEVVPHDPPWRSQFETAATAITIALEANIVTVMDGKDGFIQGDRPKSWSI